VPTVCVCVCVCVWQFLKAGPGVRCVKAEDGAESVAPEGDGVAKINIHMTFGDIFSTSSLRLVISLKDIQQPSLGTGM